MSDWIPILTLLLAVVWSLGMVWLVTRGRKP